MLSKIILALGADIKNRFVVGKGKEIHFGPEIGDLSDAANFTRFKNEINKALKKFKPDTIAYDLHPNYFSSRFAKNGNELTKQRTNEQQIQHHHAHIASVIFEHNIKAPVIGVAFDGTGYGTDGNIWGGEFLLVDKKGFERLAHLKYRQMPGAEKVVYEPWRMVLSILGERGMEVLDDIDEEDKKIIVGMLKKNINSPLTSSAGRLFDAAAALLGVCRVASYEAEGPMKLQALCDEGIRDFYSVNISGDSINTDAIFSGMLKDLKNKKDKSFIATKFHNSIARLIIDRVRLLSRRLKIKNIALSGGVFGNKFLTKKTSEGLEDTGLRVYINKKYSVNDLNIAIGQYYVSCSSCKD
jgi:hydrogenase maturation protein HypF